MSSGSESEFEVDFILDSRKKGRATEFKVRWKNFGTEEDSWEPERELQKTAPKIIHAFKQKSGKQIKEVQSSAKRDSSRTSKSGSTTVTTTTTKQTVSKMESFSDASDTETPTRVVHRSIHTERVTESSSDKPSVAAKCLWNPLSCACGSLAAMKNDVPLMIYMLCMIFIGATFVWEKL